MAVSPASATAPPGGPLVVAVADGHGHARHFRSRRGANLAVEVACELARAKAEDLATAPTASAATAVGIDLLAAAIVERWQAAVRADVAASPFTPEEIGPSGLDADDYYDDPLVAYGTTLLVVTVAGRWVLCVQIGDGEIVAVGTDGHTRSPVPGDPHLDGRRTTSLCQVDALRSFRSAALDPTADPVSAVLVATDGYSNAQVEEPWQPGVGRDIHRFLHERGVAWVASSLPEWVARCASSQGSADDTTVALLVPTAEASAVASTEPAPTGAASAVAPPIVPTPTVPGPTVPAPTEPAPPGPALVEPVAALPTERRTVTSDPAARVRPRWHGLVIGAVALAVLVGVAMALRGGSGGKGGKLAGPVVTTPRTVPATTLPLVGDRSTARPVLHDNGTVRDENGDSIPFPPGVIESAVLDEVQAGPFVVILVSDGRLYRLAPGAAPVATGALNQPGPGLDYLSDGSVTVPAQAGAVSYRLTVATMQLSCRPTTAGQQALCGNIMAGSQ